jgi:carbon monoxide dehydrogenase subunit G
MSTSKFTSEVKNIQHSQEVVYSFLSDFNKLGAYFNEYTLAQISQQLPSNKITGIRCDTDSCTFLLSNNSEGGIKIIDREFPKTVKMTGAGQIPFELFIWIQILPVNANQSKIRVTLHAELNMMMKMMAGKKLKEGVDKIADALTLIPYH